MVTPHPVTVSNPVKITGSQSWALAAPLLWPIAGKQMLAHMTPRVVSQNTLSLSQWMLLPCRHTGDSTDPFLQVSKETKFGINPSSPFPPKPSSHSHPFGWGRPCSSPFLAASLSLLISFQGVLEAAKSRQAALQVKHPYLQRLCGQHKWDHWWGNYKGLKRVSGQVRGALGGQAGGTEGRMGNQSMDAASQCRLLFPTIHESRQLCRKANQCGDISELGHRPA